MFYTPAGGDIMFVEASLMRAKASSSDGPTGRRHEESARAAWTFARSHAGWLGIDEKDFDRHSTSTSRRARFPRMVPPPASPWPRPCVALSKRPVRNDVAMTGEITLSGRILPIGGLKEKILGAVRAGITSIVIPKENQADLEDLTEEVRDSIEVSPVATLAEALAVTIRDTALEDGRLLFGVSSARQIGPDIPH